MKYSSLMKKILFLIFLTIIVSCKKDNYENVSEYKHTIDSLKIELSKSSKEINLLKNEIKIKSEVRKKSNVKYNNESFDSFFSEFMTDSSFQIQRIKFPLEYITWTDDIGGEIDTIEINKNEWKHDYFYFNTANERTQIYDNFELSLAKTNERLIHWYGIESGGDSKYFFIGEKGKWYLVKKEQLGD